MRNRVLGVLLACLACSTRQTPEPVDAGAVRASIEATNAKLVAWYGAGQLDSVAAAYAPEAIAMGPNTPATVGRDSIRAWWAGVMSSAVPRFTLVTQTVLVADSLAVEHGRYTLQLRAKAPADTAKVLMDDRGNYVVAWIRRDGRWLLLYDIATTELPVVPATGKK